MPSIPDFFEGALRASDILLASRAGEEAIAHRRRRRLADLVDHARRRSPFFGDLYRDLPPGEPELGNLPPVAKPALMGAFDRWITDPAASLDRIGGFLADRGRVGQLLDDRFAIWKSSGTSGEPGIFVHDAGALAIYDLLFALRAWEGLGWPGASMEMWARGGRMACVTALEDHYAGISSWRRLAISYPHLGALMRDFSVLEPLDRLVDALNRWRPNHIVAYPSVLALLAREREAGRLHLSPSIIFAGGECLDGPEHDLIEGAFGCPVRSVYACSECDYIAFGCAHRNLHVNADWVILEPVDSDYRPVPPGVASDTVLVTNLANRIQPVIRYDLGDCVTALAEPCPCGSPLPVIRVEGRRGQVLHFAVAPGRVVTILPMAITTAVELAEGVGRFRIVRDGAASVRVEFEPAPGHEAAAAAASIRAAMRKFMADNGLGHVEIAALPATLPVDPPSGKFSQVVSMFDGG
jgi:phenylacetate-coenzyme A ligase PaaK-like adenylate-forming protein